MTRKKIMIEGAMELETELLTASLEQPRESVFGGWRFIEGIYKDIPLIVGWMLCSTLADNQK